MTHVSWKRWMLVAATWLVPFGLVYLNAAVYYSRTSWRYSNGCLLVLPVALAALAIPIRLIPLREGRSRELVGILVFMVSASLLLIWNLVCALLHGDAL